MLTNQGLKIKFYFYEILFKKFENYLFFSIFATLRQLIQKKADLDKCIEDNFVTNNQVTEIFIKLNIIQAKLLK